MEKINILVGRGKKLILGFLFLVILFFFRFYNLGTSARFVWDESSDLVRMHQLFENPKLTMLGPISEDGVKIFSSLTYYLTLPFVILFKFDPVSSAYATATFGIFTVIIFLIIAKLLKLPVWQTALLFLISSPLLEAARWAWNPHFIPFWQSLGVLFYLLGSGLGLVFSGIFFGLTVHQHYYAIFALTGMALLILTDKKNRIKKILWFISGVLVSLFPFLLFDITHPPGLFISRMLFFSPISAANGAFQVPNIFSNLVKTPILFLNYLCNQNKVIVIVVLLLSLVNIFLTIRQKTYKWLIPAIVQLLGLTVISGDVYNHYLLPAIIFYYLWLLTNFNKNIVSKILIYTLIGINLASIPKILFKNDWSTNIDATKKITNIISNEYALNQNKFNIAVLGSPDPNTKGRRYRDLLNLRKIDVEPADNYSSVNSIFYISYKDWVDLKNDPSYEINQFRNKNPDKIWTIDNSQWKVYLLIK